MRKKCNVSEMDKLHLEIIRKSVVEFLEYCANKYDKDGLLLDIAPQDYEGARPYFLDSKVYTLDINPKSNADYIADICNKNDKLIQDSYFDFVVCTEVLEHTLNPFSAVQEIKRILKPGGLLFITTPYNFRIHGPLPDCWRFTEHGLRELLKDFKLISLETVETEARELMPIQYKVIVQKYGGELDE